VGPAPQYIVVQARRMSEVVAGPAAVRARDAHRGGRARRRHRDDDDDDDDDDRVCVDNHILYIYLYLSREGHRDIEVEVWRR